MLTGLFVCEVPLETLYQELRLESDAALRNANHELATADFWERLSLPRQFPEEPSASESSVAPSRDDGHSS